MKSSQRENPLATDEERASSQANTGWIALFGFTQRSHLAVLLPSVFLAAGAGVLQPCLTIFFGKFFDAFSAFGGDKIDGQELLDRTERDAYALIALGATTWLVKGSFFAGWLLFGELQAQSVRNSLFDNLLKKDLDWYERRTSGVAAWLSQLQTQVRELQMGTSQPLGFVVNHLVEGLAGLGVAFFYSWRLTLVTLAVVPVCAISLPMISSDVQPNITAQQTELTKASKVAMSVISNIATVKCSNTQKQECRRYKSYIQNAAAFYIRQARANALQMGFSRAVTTSLFIPGLWYGEHLVNGGTSTAGNVMTAFLSCLLAAKAFEDLLPYVLMLEKGQIAAIALRGLLDDVSGGGKLSKMTQGISPEFCEGDIEFRDISFAYSSRPNQLVIKGSTFFFPAGETTFVIGRSGSGKSTIGSLLMRFYRPTTGDILIDGNPIQHLSSSWIHNNITLVQQQSILFDESILRNIAFGHRDHEHISQQHIEPCLDLAVLQETIATLPRGLGTMVGVSGSQLSGGQIQRVAIARSRLRDAPILILDESSSALDPITRTKVMANIRQWRQNKTTIVITHDLSQIGIKDFVYTLDDGQIVTEGYRNAVEAHLRTSEFTFDHEHLDTGTNTPLEFPRPSKPVSKRVAKGSHSRKDSIAIHLETITQAGNEFSAFAHQPTTLIDRTLSRRLSGTATAVLNALGRPLPLQRREQVLSFPEHYHDSEMPSARPVGDPRIRVGRPMSVHQAMMMRFLQQSSASHEPRPKPLLRESPVSYRKLSVRRSLASIVPFISVPAYQAASIPKIIASVWPQLDRKNRGFLICGFSAALIHAALSPVFSFILVQLFRTLYDKRDQAGNTLIYSMIILGIAVVDGLTVSFMYYLLERAAQSWIDSLRVEAMNRIVEQEKSWFDEAQNSASLLVSTLDRNPEEMRNIIGRFAALIVIVITTMTTSILWAMVTCWKLTLVTLGAAPAMYLLTKTFKVVSERWESRTSSASEVVGAVFVETFTNIRTVRAFTLESYFHKKYMEATSRSLTIGIKRAAYSGFFFGLSDSTIMFIMALMFFFSAYLAKTKAYAVPPILNSLGLLVFSSANANAVVAYIPQISSSVDAAARLLRLAHLPLRSHEYRGRLKLDPQDPVTLTGPIHFINMTFKYPTRPFPPALRKFNLTIPAGLCTAIVGNSGSGKSTIASLLLGLYQSTADKAFHSASDPDGPPCLTISGRDIRSLHIPTLRNLIALVPQTSVLFPGTVKENIIYGLDLSSPLTTSDSVEEAAARRVGIHDFVLTLPQGYDTLIGDGALGLSGGQIQRIVIARALVRKPMVLILDEVTNALDGETVRIVCESIRDLLNVARGEREQNHGRGRALTVIMITHSMEMMAAADNVVVLEAGNVVEEGGFNELLNRGRAGRLWEMLRAGMKDN